MFGDLLRSLGSFSEIIFFIPNSLSFNLESDDYRSLALYDSNLLLFLFDVYIKVLKDMLESFFVNDPGVGFFVVSYNEFG